MDIPITTHSYGREHDHGTVEVTVDDVERRLNVDVALAVAGDQERTPDQVAEAFAEELEALVQKYAI